MTRIVHRDDLDVLARTPAEVYRWHGCAVRCGRCGPEISQRLRRVRTEECYSVPLLELTGLASVPSG